MTTTNCQTAQESMDELYNKRDETGDITFVVGRKRIKAHRCVLAAISPKYRAQFFGLNPDRGEIRIPNVSAGVFNVFLEFFYKGKIDLNTGNVEAVLDLAKQSLVDKFVDTCVRFLHCKTTSANVCWAYGIAVKYDLESLRFSCEWLFQRESKQVFASDGFLNCDHEILLDVLKMDSLACTEKEVFDACVAWARANCKQKNLDDGNPKNLRAALGDAIYQIRFGSMSANEFAIVHKSVPELFTKDEAIELFYIIGKLDGFESKKFNQMPRTNALQPAVRENSSPTNISSFSPKKRQHGISFSAGFKRIKTPQSLLMFPGDFSD